MKTINKIITLTLTLALCACGGEKKEDNSDKVKANTQKKVNTVDTMHLRKGVFARQIVCNGRLRAVEKSNLNFEASGDIMEIFAFNGDMVKKGDLLAKVDTKNAMFELDKAHKAKDKAYIDLLDKLIGQGYEADTLNVEPDVLKNSKMTSGYDNAIESLVSAERTLANCSLYAPFTGRVANMDSKKHQVVTGGQFCTLIDDTYFDIEFSLLEAEINDVAKGEGVTINLFVDATKQFSGKITEINPLIDDNGQVKVRARVKNVGSELMEGMNVKIVIEREIAGQFVVPKDAVVQRDGFFVVFRYFDGEASWTYVDVVMSNIDSHVITGSAKKQTTISENDIIITTGNLNLADGTVVAPR